MERNTKADVLAPPNFGVRLLEIFLPPTAAENEIGDLEEEYSAKVKRDGLTYARRWFWIQVFYTLGASLREEGARCLLHRGAVQWYRGQDGSLQASFDMSQLGRHRVISLLILILILCAMLAYLLRPRTISPGQELAQMRNITSMLEASESPQLDHIFDKSSLIIMRQIRPAAGRSQDKVSKKTAWTGADTTTAIESQSNEGQNPPLPVPPRSDEWLRNLVLTVITEGRTSWVQIDDATQHTAVAVGQSSQGSEGVQRKEQPSAIAEGSIKAAGPETSRPTDVAYIPRERDYLSAPTVVSKPLQQTQSQAVSEGGCFR